MKRIFLLLVAFVISLVSVQPAMAQDNAPPCGVSPCYYVNPERQPSGNEDGTQSNPYNTIEEGKAYAQSLANGGYIFVRNQTTGQWERSYIPGTESGGTGAGLPNVTLYLLLGVLALILILAGWKLLQRSH